MTRPTRNPEIHTRPLPAVTAWLWGVRNWEQATALDVADRVEKGLPLSAAQRVSRYLDPDGRVSTESLLSKSTVDRLKRTPGKSLSTDLSDRVHRLSQVVAESLKLWSGDAAAVRRFLNRPHALLDQRTPIDVARESSAGEQAVLDVIRRARAGLPV